MKLNLFQSFQKYDLTHASVEFTQEILRDYNANRPMGAQDKLCMSPFKSLYFGHYGKVVSCCYNRTFVLGTFPDNSIQEIWNGAAAQQLRKSIIDNNLDQGCSGCKSLILAGNHDAVKSHQYDGHRSNKNGFPSVMEFELSNTCNLECGMCSGDFSSLIRKNREGRNPLPQVYGQNFVDQLEEFIPYLEEVKFYGGEPFLIELYYTIWERMIAINPAIRISVQTNGTVLNNRVKRILEQAEFHINLSIDSLEKTNYEQIRKNANFEHTMRNIVWFREYCRERNTFFGLSACAMRQNWHELPSFVRYCNQLQVPVYFHTVFFPKESGFHEMEILELERIATEWKKERFDATSPIEKKNKHHFEQTLKQVEYLLTEKKLRNENIVVLKNMTELGVFVQIHILNQTNWSESEKTEKTRVISAKLKLLEEKLGAEYPYEELLSRFDIGNKVVVNNLLHQIETWPVSALAMLAQTSR
jgi:radical SAM protein with 4Fe4S-binding SPASM domain